MVMARKLGYRWNLRLLMAKAGMYATSDLVPLLAERGVVLSAAQVYRLVTQTPERLSLHTLMALCDILDCTPNDLIEPAAAPAAKKAAGRVAGGRLCRNCLAILASEPCAGCGERRRVQGRDAEGRAWCTRCSNRARAAAADNQRRRLIIETVTAADPAVTAETVGAALAAAGSRRSLRLLAGHLAAHPDAFTVGPTSTLAVLERFVTALAEAGARVTVIHPVCEWCGRQRRWHARTAGGGQCTTCSARTHRAACSACGKPRRADRCDARGPPCVLQLRWASPPGPPPRHPRGRDRRGSDRRAPGRQTGCRRRGPRPRGPWHARPGRARRAGPQRPCAGPASRPAGAGRVPARRTAPRGHRRSRRVV
jgi:DNA-binding Xre family transcriptional regulator